MAIGPVVTRGYGAGASVGLVVTRGYLGGSAPAAAATQTGSGDEIEGDEEPRWRRWARVQRAREANRKVAKAVADGRAALAAKERARSNIGKPKGRQRDPRTGRFK